MTIHILNHGEKRGQVDSPAFMIVIMQVKKPRREAFIVRLIRRLKQRV